MLGLSGFVLLAVSEFDGELEQAVETTARRGVARAALRPIARAAGGAGAGPAGGGPSGDAALDQVAVAVRGAADG